MERNIALLIDFENIAAGTEKEGLGKFDIEAIISRIKDKGRILIARSYADWGRFARFKQGLLTANVTMYELTSHGMQDKNRADIAMVVDCLELAYTRDYIDTYVVVSGDSDFTPLVLKLKELNKNVIGIGTRKSTSRLIINACDEFLFYDSIVQKKAAARRAKPVISERVPVDRARALESLLGVLEGMLREDPTPPHASVLKSAMLRRQPDFNETDLGFSSFTRFVEAARDAGYVLLSRDKKSGGYVVDTVEVASDEPARTTTSSGASSAPPISDDGDVDDGAVYDDPYFPEGSDEVVRRLNAAGMGALSCPTRMVVLEALVAAADERGKRKRRVNIPFVQEDLKKRLRRTHPEMSTNHIRGLLRALMRAGALIHKDGAPIRNMTAQFELRHDPAKLNRMLAEFYLTMLRHEGVDTSNVDMLAEFLFGDRDRRRDVEEILAWQLAPRAEEPEEDDGPSERPERPERPERRERPAKNLDLDALDLDAFLFTDDETPAEAPKAKAKAPAAADADVEDAPKKKRTRSRAKKPAAADLDDDLLEFDDAPPAKAPAAKAPAAKAETKAPAAKAETKAPADKPDAKAPAAKPDAKAPAAKTDAKAPAAKPDAKAPAADAEPAKPRRSRTRKKADAPTPGDDMDALLELDE